MSKLNSSLLEHLSSFTEQNINYEEVFLNTDSIDVLNKTIPYLKMNDNLIIKYMKNNILTENICDFLCEQYPDILKKDSLFIRLFNYPTLSDEYLKKVISEETIITLQDQGLISYFYKDGQLHGEGMFRLFDMYPDVFFDETQHIPLPSVRFYAENMPLYEKYKHIVSKFSDYFKKDETMGFTLFGENGVAVFYNLNLIDINDISFETSKNITENKLFNLNKIIDNNQLSKEIINKLFNFEKPFMKEDISFNYKNYINKIPSSLINEKDKKGNNIFALLKDISPQNEVIDLLLTILNKGFDITITDEKNDSIFLRNLIGLTQSYNNNISENILKQSLNFIFENIDQYLDKKEIICEIGNKLLFYSQLTKNDKIQFMESVFAKKEMQQLQSLLTCSNKNETNHKSRL